MHTNVHLDVSEGEICVTDTNQNRQKEVEIYRKMEMHKKRESVSVSERKCNLQMVRNCCVNRHTLLHAIHEQCDVISDY